MGKAMRMRVLVTGATGFVGRNLVKHLVEKGYEVSALVRRQPDPAFDPTEQVKLHFGDVSDHDSLKTAVTNKHVVVHSAGLVAARTYDEYARVNIDGTRNLVEATLAHSPECKQFVFISSLAAARPTTDLTPHKEEDACAPLSGYGKSKLAAEQVVQSFADRLPVTIIRPPSVYGPWDHQFLPFFKLAKWALSPCFKKNTKHYSFIFVDDLIRGIREAFEHNLRSGEIFYLCDPKIYTWNDFVLAIAKALGKPTRKLPINHLYLRVAALFYDAAATIRGRALSFGLEKYREMAAPGWICSSAKAERHFSFRTNYNIEQGLIATANWYLEKGWL